MTITMTIEEYSLDPFFESSDDGFFIDVMVIKSHK